MKTLHIVRHGKSSWDDLDIEDIDRPLIDRGITSSYTMAARVFGKYGPAELVYTSPANRALHTAVIFSRVTKLSFSKLKIINEIYEAETKTLMEVIESTPDEVSNLMLFGHNPGVTNLSNLFLPSFIDNLPTCGVVSLRFDINNWNINGIVPVFAEVDFPKK